MRRLLANLVTGVQIVAFVVFCLLASPVILFHFGISALQDRIKDRLPESDRARAFSFWLGLLAPVVLLIVLVTAFGIAIVKIRERVKIYRENTCSSSTLISTSPSTPSTGIATCAWTSPTSACKRRFTA